ncbi:hypothetical protein H8957_017679, partial [Semnopithecus entellus]
RKHRRGPGEAAPHPRLRPARTLFRDQDEHTAATDKSRTGAHCPAGEEQAHITEEACIFSGLFSEK